MCPLPVPTSSTRSVLLSVSSCSIQASSLGASITSPWPRNFHVHEGKKSELLCGHVLSLHRKQSCQNGLVQHLPGADLTLDHVVAGLFRSIWPERSSQRWETKCCLRQEGCRIVANSPGWAPNFRIFLVQRLHDTAIWRSFAVTLGVRPCAGEDYPLEPDAGHAAVGKRREGSGFAFRSLPSSCKERTMVANPKFLAATRTSTTPRCSLLPALSPRCTSRVRVPISASRCARSLKATRRHRSAQRRIRRSSFHDTSGPCTDPQVRIVRPRNGLPPLRAVDDRAARSTREIRWPGSHLALRYGTAQRSAGGGDALPALKRQPRRARRMAPMSRRCTTRARGS